MNQLVNEPLIALIGPDDQIFGYAPKTFVHQHGLLHRAFSLFVFDTQQNLLLQKRAAVKYHSPGLWTNTCCGHQNKDKELEECLHTRLMEEMGMTCHAEFLFKFTYQVSFDNGLTEHETDYVFGSVWEGTPRLNPEEASDFKWISLEQLKSEVSQNPESFTYWLKYIIDHYYNDLLVFSKSITGK